MGESMSLKINMRPLFTRIHWMIVALLLLPGWIAAQGRVYVLDLRDEVHSSMARYVNRGFEAAQQAGAKAIIVHLDTYGGRVDFADSIRSRILKSPIPTVAYVDRNAASAGALIALACDSIFMAPASSMGAATVVDGHTGEAAPDKYQSYWRGVMRATAEANGRDPKIAEKMVDQKLDLPGISPAGQVITFTKQDAIDHGYSEGTLDNLQAVAEAIGMKDAQLIYYEGSGVDKAIDFLNWEVVSAILILLLFGGIIFEFKTAGMGKGGVVALLAAFLFFVPHYVNGLAETWEVAVFLMGILFIAAELFVIPGFGVAGILGIGFTLIGVTAALLENSGVSMEYLTLNDILKALATVCVLMATSVIVVIWAAKWLVTSKVAHPYVDQSTQSKEQGYTALRGELLDLVGLEAVAATDLRPVGHIIVNGKQFDAEAHEGYITKGQSVVVERVKSLSLIVRKIATA